MIVYFLIITFENYKNGHTEVAPAPQLQQAAALGKLFRGALPQNYPV